jgi:hypothetical protein
VGRFFRKICIRPIFFSATVLFFLLPRWNQIWHFYRTVNYCLFLQKQKHLEFTAVIYLHRYDETNKTYPLLEISTSL